MSALTVAQFKSAVWKFVSAQVISLVPNNRVIWTEQASPRPKLSYVGLKVIAGPRTYGDDDMRQISPGVYSIAGQRALTVSVQIFGKDAEEISALVQGGMSKPTALEALAADSVSVLMSTAPQNVSVPIETTFENRVQFDIDFGCVMATTDEVGFIEQTGIINTSNGDQTGIG